MTSGSFHSIPLDSIVVLRETRQRRELENIEELADSLHRLGLIEPLVITRDNVLVAGERRLTAARSLGWTAISAQYTDETDEITLGLIELEENIKRQDLSWQDEVQALARFHTLKKELNPEQTLEDTAQELGQSKSQISKKLAVAKELARGNELVKNADKLSTAANITEREQSRRLASAIGSTEDLIGDLTGLAKEQRNAPLLNTDFIEWADSYTGRPFNLLHCDFPYGVDMHKSGQGANQEFGSYHDSADVYWQLLDCLARNMDSLVADSAHLVFWFSMDYYHDTVSALERMGWRVNPFPLIWWKSDNTGIIPDAQRGPRRVYETALLASRGDRKLAPRGAVSNLFAAPGRAKEIHMNEKPIAMLQHFLSMLVDEYTFMLDPTAGSANALKAAQALGATQVLGIEKNEEFFTRACEAYFDSE